MSCVDTISKSSQFNMYTNTSTLRITQIYFRLVISPALLYLLHIHFIVQFHNSSVRYFLLTYAIIRDEEIKEMEL